MRQKEPKAVQFLIPAAPSPVLFLRIILKSQQICFLPHFHAFTNSVLFAANRQLLLIHLDSLALLTGASAVRKVCLLHNYYIYSRAPPYQDFVTHSYYYLGPPPPHYCRAKDPHTPVSICIVPHPADWFNSGLIKLRCHIQDHSLLSSEVDTSHTLCRPATALPVCIAIKTEQLHNVPGRCRAIESPLQPELRVWIPTEKEGNIPPSNDGFQQRS